MSILKIREIGDPVLRTRAKKVQEINEKTNKLIEDMIKTMKNNEGIGLAAPQIGVSQRIIVIDFQNKIKVWINPEIIFKEGFKIAEEGCLSVPDRTGLVKRAKFIKVDYLDRNGQKKTIKAEDLLARIIQHEIDHLNGVLFTDKVVQF